MKAARRGRRPSGGLALSIAAGLLGGLPAVSSSAAASNQVTTTLSVTSFVDGTQMPRSTGEAAWAADGSQSRTRDLTLDIANTAGERTLMVATWLSSWYQPHRGRVVVAGTFGTQHLGPDELGMSSSLIYEYCSRNKGGAWGTWKRIPLGYAASPTLYTSLGDGHFQIRATATSMTLRQTQVRISLDLTGIAYEHESWTVTG